MSEQFPVQSPEQAVGAVESQGPEQTYEAAPVSPEQQAEQLESARSAAYEAAAPTERLALPIDDKPADNQPLYIDRVVKKLKLKQSMGQVRSQLSPASRALSRVIHQPVVRAVSEAGARTISRPSGLLGGGVMAFAGSLAYLYLAKHIGFSYNYLLFTLFFAGGFLLGLLFELFLYVVRPKHRQD